MVEKDSWKWGAFEGCYGNLVQWKLPKLGEGNPN